MAKFDLSISPNSTVGYISTDTFLTVEWNQLRLHDSPEEGFTFQTTLHKNGTIVFAYKSIPISIRMINDTQHPVKVGLTNAYVRDKNIFIQQKIIYEYHRVDVKEKPYEIVNGSAIIFRPKETCLGFQTCGTCTTGRNGTDFDCAWCPKLNRCSSGMDINRQEWVLNSCDKDEVNIQRPEECYAQIPIGQGSQNSAFFVPIFLSLGFNMMSLKITF